MNKTQRLFDMNAYTSEFCATVMSAEENGDGTYDVILDKTAFFPNEGGQTCDTGHLNGVAVVSVDEADGIIVHKVTERLSAGDAVQGSVLWEPRLRKMQNHTGEHIISGLIYKHFGYKNVGFHLGELDVTADFDGELTESDIRMIERLANGIVFECHEVRAYYPDSCELEKMEYRSKLDITEGVRIVDIDGVDKCACCAPHVSNTGMVGLIKILDYIRYKGGVRIHMQCGYDALRDYNARYEEMRRVSMAISAKQLEISQGVERLLEENGALKGRIAALKREMNEYKLASLEESDGSICLFDGDTDMTSARNFVNEAVKKTCGVCALFCGDDSQGYKYIVASERVDLKALSPILNKALGGRGGGSDKMIQGSCTAKRADIEAFISGIDK